MINIYKQITRANDEYGFGETLSDGFATLPRCQTCHNQKYTRQEGAQSFDFFPRKKYGDFMRGDLEPLIQKTTYEKLVTNYPFEITTRPVHIQSQYTITDLPEYIQLVPIEEVPLNREKMKEYLRESCDVCGLIDYDWSRITEYYFTNKPHSEYIFKVKDHRLIFYTEEGKKAIETLGLTNIAFKDFSAKW